MGLFERAWEQFEEVGQTFGVGGGRWGNWESGGGVIGWGGGNLEMGEEE